MTTPREPHPALPSPLSRRAALVSAATGSAVLLSGCAARAEAKAPAAPTTTAAPPPVPPGVAFAGKHAPLPLPFDPKSLRGISEKLIVSHHDNNYAGAVKNLVRVEEELGRVSKDTPAFVVGALKQSELAYRGSATLHELYFANLGGAGGSATGAIEKVLADAYGGLARWEELFRATGASLGGGAGWVVTAWDLHRDAPYTFWSGNHTQAFTASLPLLVMDMYEHAYQMDHGAAFARYIDAFFANVHWDEVNRRLERARKAAAAMRA
jgi:Fe-Mn family superoxide dismutase